MKVRNCFNTTQYSLVICRNPFRESPNYGKWLAINETGNKGWWIPGGAVEIGESFKCAAIRECKEEAGIDVDLKGILKIDHSVKGDTALMRVIYYAEPKDLTQSLNLKTVADSESLEAKWVTNAELALMKEQK